MNKIKLIFIIALSIVLLSFAHQSFAFEDPNAIFSLSKVVTQQKIPRNSKDVQVVNLLPFTVLVIKPETFQQDVTISVFEGNFDNVKKILPQDQSPISSYYFVFRSADGVPVSPLTPINVQSINNYIDTNTFYYPMSSIREIDKVNQKEYQGHIRVNVDLPVNDPAFIVATNKIISKSEIESQKPSPTLTAAPLKNQSNNKRGKATIWPTAVALAVVITLILVVFGIIWRRTK